MPPMEPIGGVPQLEATAQPGRGRNAPAVQQAPPARTRKKASMSASVPVSPSELKSALLVQGAAGQVPARHAKKASMSESVPVSPSQLKSALPHPPPVSTLFKTKLTSTLGLS